MLSKFLGALTGAAALATGALAQAFPSRPVTVVMAKDQLMARTRSDLQDRLRGRPCAARARQDTLELTIKSGARSCS